MRSAARGKFHGSPSSFARTLAVPDGQDGQRHLAASQPVHRFVHRAVSAADDGELSRLLNGAPRKDGRLTGSGRLLQFRFDSRFAENAPRLVELRHTAAASRGGIDDQHGVAKFRRHSVHSVPSKRNFGCGL